MSKCNMYRELNHAEANTRGQDPCAYSTVDYHGENYENDSRESIFPTHVGGITRFTTQQLSVGVRADFQMKF